jgi:hypothetical protein
LTIFFAFFLSAARFCGLIFCAAPSRFPPLADYSTLCDGVWILAYIY